MFVTYVKFLYLIVSTVMDQMFAQLAKTHSSSKMDFACPAPPFLDVLIAIPQVAPNAPQVISSQTSNVPFVLTSTTTVMSALKPPAQNASLTTTLNPLTSVLPVKFIMNNVWNAQKKPV